MFRRLLASCGAFAALCVLAAAQYIPAGFLPVGQTNLVDSNGVAMNNATMCAQVTLNGQPATVQVNGSGTVSFATRCTPIVNGHWTMNLPDMSLTVPKYVCLAMDATDNVTGNHLLSGYSCVQPRSVPPPNIGSTPFWCTSSACNFDLLPPNYPANLAFVAPPGPIGPKGDDGVGVALNDSSLASDTSALLKGVTARQSTAGPVDVPATDTLPLQSTAPKNPLDPQQVATVSQAERYARQSSGANNFGDSITSPVCGGALSNDACYAYLLDRRLGGYYVNYGRSSDQCADTNWLWLYPNTNPQATGNAPTTMMVSTNDWQYYGNSDSGKVTIFNRCILSNIAWSTIPRSAKLFLQDSDNCIPQSGTWTADDLPVKGMGEKSSVDSSSITCKLIAQGASIYVGYPVCDGNTHASVSVLIDGFAPSIDATIYNSGSSLVQTHLGTTCYVAVARYPITAGTHYVNFTAHLDGAGYAGVSWLGSTAVAADTVFAPPRLYVGGTPYVQSDGSSAVTAAYNGYILAEVNLALTDTLPVTFVDVRNGFAGCSRGLNTDTDYAFSSAPPIHPGNGGHSTLADIFYCYMKQNRPFGRGSYTAMALGAGFTPYSGWQAPGFYKDGSFVRLTGLVQTIASNSNAVIYQLPGGFRPSAKMVFPVASGNNSVVTVMIDVDGTVNVYQISNPDPGYISLDGITFTQAN